MNKEQGGHGTAEAYGWSSRKSGAALGLALLALVVFSLLGAGLMNLASVNGVQTERSIGDLKSFWAAEAGLAEARALAQKYSRPFESIPGMTLSWTDQVDGVAYRVVITPDALNGVSAIKKYDVVATGTTVSGGSRVVRQHAEIETFASYMHASNYEQTSGGDNIYFGPGDRIDGMVYSNDQLNLYGGSPDPIFLQLARSAASSVNYANGADSTSFTGGLQLNAPRLNFATNLASSVQAFAQNGGLSLTGDYSISFTNSSVVSRKWTGSTYGAATTNALSSFNGAVYVSGAVRAISGTVSGNVTVASATTMQITGDLVYQSAPAKATLFSAALNPSTIHDSLGLVANTGVTIMGTSEINIHAAILVSQGDSGLSADQSNSNFGQPYINLFGSVSQYRRGIVGYADGRGFRKNYKYDLRFLSSPPSYFPYSSYALSAWRQS